MNTYSKKRYSHGRNSIKICNLLVARKKQWYLYFPTLHFMFYFDTLFGFYWHMNLHLWSIIYFSFLLLVLHQNQPLDALLCTTLFMKKYRAGQRGAPKYQDLISRVLVGANDALRSIK